MMKFLRMKWLHQMLKIMKFMLMKCLLMKCLLMKCLLKLHDDLEDYGDDLQVMFNSPPHLPSPFEETHSCVPICTKVSLPHCWCNSHFLLKYSILTPSLSNLVKVWFSGLTCVRKISYTWLPSNSGVSFNLYYKISSINVWEGF